MSERPSWDETLMAIAYDLSKRSTCDRRHVGAIISSHRGVTLSPGYNGAIRGFPHCEPHKNCQPCRTTVHAETNAILNAAYEGIRLKGTQIHVTDLPCPGCAKAIIQSGITRVVYDRDYRDNRSIAMFAQANVLCVKFSDLLKDTEKELPDETTQ